MYRENRLAYFINEDNSDFWTNHWATTDWRAWLESGKAGNLGHFTKPFLKYLPKAGKILEAGCGLGQLVLALRARDYDVEGVELSQPTISMVKEHIPAIPVQHGDVRQLDYPDNYFVAYISLGVVEHFEEGPKPVLKEAYRVMKPDGFLFVSVPRIHILRRLKIFLGRFSKPCAGTFYQYAFARNHFENIVKEVGFSIKEIQYYGAYKGCKDEISLLNSLHKRGKIPRRMIQVMETHWLFNYPFSHMMLFVATKPALPE